MRQGGGGGGGVVMIGGGRVWSRASRDASVQVKATVMRYSKAIGVLVAVVMVLCAGGVEGAWFMPLPQLPGSAQAGHAFAVSADGSTVVGTSHDGAAFQAVKWSVDGAIEKLDAGDFSFARDVAGDGKTIAGYRSFPGDQEAFVWTSAHGAVRLGDFPGGRVLSAAYGVSSNGSVVVGGGTSDLGGEAFRWTATEGFTPLGDLPGREYGGVAYAASSDGSVIVGYSRSTGGTEAFRWTAESGMVGLGDLAGGGFFSEAYDVSADGKVIVGRSIQNDGVFPSRAFRWTAEQGMIAIPDLPGVGPASIAEGISGDGSVVVGGAVQGDSAFAFAWDDYHGTRSIADILALQGVDLDGFQPGKVTSASYDGLTLVGIGLPRDGQIIQPWVARLDEGTFVPEPSTLSLGAVAFFTSLALWHSVGTAG